MTPLFYIYVERLSTEQAVSRLVAERSLRDLFIGCPDWPIEHTYLLFVDILRTAGSVPEAVQGMIALYDSSDTLH